MWAEWAKILWGDVWDQHSSFELYLVRFRDFTSEKILWLATISPVKTDVLKRRFFLYFFFTSLLWLEIYSDIPFPLACNCSSEGSATDEACNALTGDCACKDDAVIGGKNCDRCVEGHYGFPNCQSSKSDIIYHVHLKSQRLCPIFYFILWKTMKENGGRFAGCNS